MKARQCYVYTYIVFLVCLRIRKDTWILVGKGSTYCQGNSFKTWIKWTWNTNAELRIAYTFTRNA